MLDMIIQVNGDGVMHMIRPHHLQTYLCKFNFAMMCWEDPSRSERNGFLRRSSRAHMLVFDFLSTSYPSLASSLLPCDRQQIVSQSCDTR